MNWIKATLTVSFLLLILISGNSQNTPQSIYYQAVARGDEGNELIDEDISIRLNILDEGGIIYQELHSPTTDQFGLFELLIGTGQLEVGNFSNIDWGSENHFLNIEIDSGDGYESVSTTQFLSVPYSLYAERAGTVDNIDDADANPSNELINSFSINDDALEIMEDGILHSVPLSELADDGDWQINATTLTTEALNVGINTPEDNPPTSTLLVNGSLATDVQTIISTATPQEFELNQNHNVILCDVAAGSINLILPAADVANGRSYHIKRYDSTNPNGTENNNIVTIRSDGFTIDLLDEITMLGNDYQFITLTSNGENWFILNFGSN